MANFYCSDPVPPYVPDACANDPSRVVAVAFIRSDFEFTDPTDAAEWTAGQAADQIIVINNTRGEKPKASPTTIDGFGLQRTRTVGYERTLSYQHPDVKGNEDFYDALNFSQNYRLAFVTPTSDGVGTLWLTYEAVANVDSDYVVGTEIDGLIHWDVAVSWSENKMAKSYDAPTGIFSY